MTVKVLKPTVDYYAGAVWDKGGAVYNAMHPDFGAVGNGTFDNTTVLQAAIDAASAVGGGTVLVPPGTFLWTGQLVLPPYVSLKGVGRATILKWGGSGFGIKAGNNAGALSYGITLADFTMLLASAGNKGITPYGVAQCSLTNLYIEGLAAGTNEAVQIDGANVSAFFVVMSQVVCNHVKKGFTHTTTGTVVPTQVTGIGCTVFADDVAGSIGIDIQNVAGVGCGDGVVYAGGNMEHCAIGARLNGAGTTLNAVRFENLHTNEDIKFDTLARNNLVVGCPNVFTITDSASSPTNQVLGVGKDLSAVVSQKNKLDSTLLSGDTQLQSPAAASDRYVYMPSSHSGRLLIQSGPGSSAYGASIALYGDAHASKPNHVVVGGTGGKFRVNDLGLDGGNDKLVTDLTTGITTVKGLGVTEGTNAKMGTAVLVAGSKVVSTTAVTANSRIYLTSNVDGGTPGWVRVSARTAGTSFTITSSSGTDTSTVAWVIVEPG